MRIHFFLILVLSFFLASGDVLANARPTVEATKRDAELNVRKILEPIVSRYCSDQCKILSVQADVDLVVPDQIAPGFEETIPLNQPRLSPSMVRVKMLMDEMIGPVSRGKFLDLMNEHLSGLEFPVSIDAKVTHFPTPQGSARRVAELREKVVTQFKESVGNVVSKFCPHHCVLTELEVQVDQVNPEEAQFGQIGEFYQDGDTAVRVRKINATLMIDQSLPAEDRANIAEMVRLKTASFKNVEVTAKSLNFPTAYLEPGVDGVYAGIAGKPGRSIASAQLSKENKESVSSLSSENVLNSNQTTSSSVNSSNQQNTTAENINTTNESAIRQERFERLEKIERVENGDAVQAELVEFKKMAAAFGGSVLALLLLLIYSSLRAKSPSKEHTITQVLESGNKGTPAGVSAIGSVAQNTGDERASIVAKRYEVDRLQSELAAVYAENPRVAKEVFSRVLTEEGIETTSAYIDIFGEAIVLGMLRDPSLQSDLSELMEFYAKNPTQLNDDDKLELLRSIYNRTIAAKMFVLGHRSFNLFDYLSEMDGMQISELISNESVTVKAIVLTQVDPQKRTAIFSKLDENTRIKLMTELSRIDHLPRNYIFNVAQALKRKRIENPKLNTDSLPGSDVLVNLLEKADLETQRNIVKTLDATNPESSRTVKTKLVSLDTLSYLRDNHILEVVLSLRHDELLQFLKGAPYHVKSVVLAKSPSDLVSEMEEELNNMGPVNRDIYLSVERKVINRIKVMANDGTINLVDINDRVFGTPSQTPAGQDSLHQVEMVQQNSTAGLKKVAGW